MHTDLRAALSQNVEEISKARAAHIVIDVERGPAGIELGGGGEHECAAEAVAFLRVENVREQPMALSWSKYGESAGARDRRHAAPESRSPRAEPELLRGGP